MEKGRVANQPIYENEKTKDTRCIRNEYATEIELPISDNWYM
jgi:hypothetical protein